MEKAQIYFVPLRTATESDVGNGAVVRNGFATVPSPVFSTEGAAAMDFYSANLEPVSIEPGTRVLISLGIKVALPKMHKLTLKPRSGLALKNGITLANSPGTIDSDYRGVVGAIVQNMGTKTFIVEPFMRICQGEIEVVTGEGFVEVDSEDKLGNTTRGEGGFNSTGIK